MNGPSKVAVLAGAVLLLAQPAAARSTQHDAHACAAAIDRQIIEECSEQERAVAEAKRQARLSVLAAGWTPAQKKAFKLLDAAVEEYRSQRAQTAYAGDGNVRALNMDYESEEVGKAFIAFVEALAVGKIPPAGLHDFQRADRLLNANYKKALSKSFGPEYLKDAQRAWIAYRDAAVAFAKVKSPGLTSHAAATWLTMQRAEELR